MPIVRIGFVVAGLLVVSAASVTAQPWLEKPVAFGFRGGLASSTAVVAEPPTSTEPSFTLGVFADYQFEPRWHAGVALDFHEIGTSPESELLLNLLVSLKGNWSPPSAAVVVRPGLTIGFGSQPRLDGVGEDLEYLLVGAGFEVVVDTGGDVAALFEASVLAAPAGGNSLQSVHLGRFLLIRGGVLF